MTQEDEDEVLVHQFKKTRDQNLIAELYRRHWWEIYRACRRVLKDSQSAEDATHDTFVKVLLKIDQCTEAFLPWLKRIAKTTCLNKLRLASVRRESQSLDDGLYEQDDALYEQIRDIRFTVSLDHIYELIEQLPDSQRICIKLRIQGYSYQEIADLTGGHYDQVKSHIQNGKRNLSISALKVEK